MRRELLELAAELARRGEPFVLATVVARVPPVSAQVGDTALVTADGGFHGWVGGSCTRPTVIAEAALALADGRPRLIALDPDPDSRRRPGLTVFPMTCHSGGAVEIHIQPVMPPARLVIYGLSPTARALVKIGKAAGYRVELVDPAAEAADFPEADAVLTDVAAVAGSAGPGVNAVVATQGQWDEEATEAAAKLDPPAAYVGVLASAKRFGEMKALLPGLSFERVKNPAGLDLGATRPEEIAVSILAEIIQMAAGRSTRTTTTPTSTSTLGSGLSAREERDPVCGMMVRVMGAQHRARHEGRDFFFCCGGCKARFLAAPAQFLVGAGA